MNLPETVRIDADWLARPSVLKLFEVLDHGAHETMVSGGAVRNALMKRPATDVDFATTLLPAEVIDLAHSANLKTIPTGIEHGTVSVLVDGDCHEITTLREDIETDGRHAVVRFGKDWEADANRRDLTINALFCDREGKVRDYVGGLSDIRTATIRFIGNAETRIREDALRILRFYRFFAAFGQGRPDAEGLKATGANKERLENLSAERVWMELKKLLSADDPSRALLWMRTTGVLSQVLPETERWGIGAINGLIRNEAEHGWVQDPLLRLMAMVRPDRENVKTLSRRLKMSNREHRRLLDWSVSPVPRPDMTRAEFDRLLYRGRPQALRDALCLEVVHLQDRGDDHAGKLVSLVSRAARWKKPAFPVGGQDLVELGLPSGPEIGESLANLENKWIESDFKLSKQELMQHIGKLRDG